MPIAQAGRHGDRRRPVGGHARSRARARRGAGVADARRPPRRRPPRAARRRAGAARDLPVPLAPPHARRGREAPRAARRPRRCSSRAGSSSSTCSRRATRTSPRRTGSGSSASPGSSSAPTGTRPRDADALGALGRRRRVDGAALALGDRVAPPDRRGRLRRRGALRLVRPPAVRGRRRHDLGLPATRRAADACSTAPPSQLVGDRVAGS